ncbi:hypothetical protein H257_14085 [Aphanomyces astaci]|uniref:Adenylate kinase active site lid domain-containing protein n=2 Tax=Aphanomyces astaci TaxID=112090 RepID=W4FUS1_APHAT|nr:hypothetical protein H257_14085 [Aphanomyces astaci]ETV70408.1 hypothetical protein H257_14085 [Aphanomyces astaci]|eukprot:XP_009840120.1 hypothetical protein H257_14085 [Aphanomyces astaci]
MGIHAFVTGPPGSGKTSLCKKVCGLLQLEHLSTGDLLREHIRLRTEYGKVAKKCIAAKSLVPDSVVIDMIADCIAKLKDSEGGWILDGFPRTVDQAKALQVKGVTPNVVLVLELPSSEVRGRLVGRRFDPKTGDIYHAATNMPRDLDVAARLVHRDDDTPEKIPSRVDAYATYGHDTNREFLAVAFPIDADASLGDVVGDAVQILQSHKMKKPASSNQSHNRVNINNNNNQRNQDIETKPAATSLAEVSAKKLEPEETEFSPPKSTTAFRRTIPSTTLATPTANKIEHEIQRVVLHENQPTTPPKTAMDVVTKQVDTERFKTMLISGFDVIKHGRRGAPHTRTLFCDVELKRLFWQKPDKKELKAKLDQSIAIADVIQVVQGIKTDVFKRSGDTAKTDRYLSLIADDRTLDIEVASDELCSLLLHGLNAMLVST